MRKRIFIYSAALLVASVIAMRHYPISHTQRATFLQTVHAADGCSLETLEGGYAVYGPGYVIQPPPQSHLPAGPVAEVARYVFDGNGRFSGNGAISLDGVILLPSLAGTYIVEPDCTFSITITTSIGGAPGPTIHGLGVIADKGKEIAFIQTDPGFVQYRVMRKQERSWDGEDR